MSFSINKHAVAQYSTYLFALLFLSGLYGVWYFYSEDYSLKTGFTAGSGSIRIKTTQISDDSSDLALKKTRPLTFTEARNVYRDVIFGQLFVPDIGPVRPPQPDDGVDNDFDGKIDEELLDGKDDDGDGRIDEDVRSASDGEVVEPVMYPSDGIDNDKDGRIDEELENGKDDDGDGLIDEDLREPLPYIDPGLINLLGTVRSQRGWQVLVSISTFSAEPGNFARIVGEGEVIPGTEDPEIVVLKITSNKILLGAEGYENTWIGREITYKGKPWIVNKSVLGNAVKEDSEWMLRFREGGSE